MGVHRRRAVQEALEGVPAQAHGAGQPHRRPYREAPADPVAEAEDPVRLDPERLGDRRRGGDGGEMPVGGVIAEPLAQPRPRRVGVGHGLLRREGLGDDNDQGRGRIQAVQGLGDVEAVDVGGEAQVDEPIQRPQRLPHQAGPKIGAADADVDDGLERLAARARDRAGADAVGEGLHGLAPRDHLGPDRLALGGQAGGVGGAKGGVQGRAVLGDVHRLPAEQTAAGGLDVGGAREAQRRLESGLRPGLLGMIEPKPGGLEGQGVQPSGFLVEQPGDPPPVGISRFRLQRRPRGFDVGHGHPARLARKQKAFAPIWLHRPIATPVW